MDDGAFLLRIEDILADHAPGIFLRELATQFAERYLAEHYQELAAKVNQDAIATMTVAEIAAALKDSIEKTTAAQQPTRTIIEKETEIWQRGLLGGLKRIR